MPTYICSFEHEGTRYYFDFSTVVDAPTTHAMTRAEYEAYYRRMEGERGMRDLPPRLERADAKGTSSMLDPSMEAVVSCNRAGPGEKRISVKDLLALVLAERPTRAKAEPTPGQTEGGR